jgi:hypothetical protein
VTLRPLTTPERELLEFLLDQDFPGRAELRAQTHTVKTSGRSCPCGCPSFALIPNQPVPSAPIEARMVSDAHGTDPAGNLVGVLLFADDGYLSEVEVYSVTGADISELPLVTDLKPNEWSEPSDRGTRHLLNP